MKFKEIKDNLVDKATDIWDSYGEEIVYGAVMGVGTLLYGITMYELGCINGANTTIKACESAMPEVGVSSRLIQAGMNLKK